MTLSAIKSGSAALGLCIMACGSGALAAPAAKPSTPDVSDTAASPDPQSMALARQIVAAALPPERRQAMMDKLMRTMIDQMKGSFGLDKISDPGLHKILDDYLQSVPDTLRPALREFLPKQAEAMAVAYTHLYTQAQLRDIAAFAATPSGGAYFGHSLDVMSDPAVAAANREYFEAIRSIEQSSVEQLKAKVAAYIKAHPDALNKKAADGSGK